MTTAKKKDTDNVEAVPFKGASVNIKQYCNVHFPYNNIDELDRDEILADLVYWYDLISEFEKTRNEKVSEVPGDIEVVKECTECGSDNLVYTTGTGKNGKIWHAFDCQDCTKEYQGKQVPTKIFTTYKKAVVNNLVDDLPDDDAAPF